MNTGINAINEAVQEAGAFVRPLFNELGKVIVGQAYLVDRLVIGLLANGHVLLEGVPGLAKTLSVKTLANCLNVRFSRLQFTPDMLPADVVGTQIYNPQSGAFTTRKGPIFANLVLATQNPIEQEGTYPLPEAQTDRFLFKLIVDYPELAEESAMLQRWGQVTKQPALTAVSNGEELLALRHAVDQVHVSPAVQSYILALVRATRARATPAAGALRKRHLSFGASPRASLALNQAGRALAWLRGQDFVSPALLQELAPDVLRHRVGLTYEAEAEEITADKIIAEVIATTQVPAHAHP